MIKVKLRKVNGKWVGTVPSTSERMQFGAREPSRSRIEQELRKTLGIRRALKEEIYIEKDD